MVHDLCVKRELRLVQVEVDKEGRLWGAVSSLQRLSSDSQGRVQPQIDLSQCG